MKLSRSPSCLLPRLSGTYDAAQERAAAHTIVTLATRRKSWGVSRASRYMRRSGKVQPEMGANAPSSSMDAAESTLESTLESSFESYQYVGEDSRVHLDMRFRANDAHYRRVDMLSAIFVLGARVPTRHGRTWLTLTLSLSCRRMRAQSSACRCRASPWPTWPL